MDGDTFRNAGNVQREINRRVRSDQDGDRLLDRPETSGRSGYVVGSRLQVDRAVVPLGAGCQRLRRTSIDVGDGYSGVRYCSARVVRYRPFNVSTGLSAALSVGQTTKPELLTLSKQRAKQYEIKKVSRNPGRNTAAQRLTYA